MATTPTNNPVPSEAPADLKFNAGKIDEFVTSPGHQYIDRKGVAHRTIAGINYDANQAFLNYGYITKDSFELGNTLNSANEVLRWQSNGWYYRWDGAFPKVVPAGSTPDSAGGIGKGKWLGVGNDATLREELTDTNGGDSVVSSQYGGTIQDSYVSRQRAVADGVHLFLVYGQSNAKGQAANSAGAPTYVSPLARYYNGSTLAPMTAYMITSNDSASTGGAWLAFANKYIGLSGKECVFTNSGKDSQSIAQLQKGDSSNNYANMLTFCNAAKQKIMAEGKTISEITVLFVQGERDEALATTKSAYKAALTQLWTDLKADTGATRLFNFTVGTYNDSTMQINSWAIQDAQREFSAENNDVYTASELLPRLKTQGMGVDTVHLNQRGYNILGEDGARTVDDIINGNKANDGLPLLDRQGTLNMSYQQDWMLHGAWITKANGAWNFRADQSRAVSLISAIQDNSTDYLLVKIPTDLSYLLSADGTNFYANGYPELKIRFDKSMYMDRDEGGYTLAKMYFIADVQVQVNLSTKAFNTTGRTNLDLSSVMTGVFGTGVFTLTHPSCSSIPICQSMTAGASFLSVRQSSNQTGTIVDCVDVNSAPKNIYFMMDMKGMIIPPRALPNGIEVFFNVIGAKKTGL
ncbi:sialate O-acetylesterase [Enterobacter hormaechei]|uniref:tail fiber/spike domain-containing protein n=1 Tax=Enterobacter hormaechei TaxID=158836 RepID=UPI001F1F2510|nr:sialate O-acetylesterase [Enterobacter hormaechei]MCF2195171.1 hypothetical protein [Enterobacter hormaechei]